MRLKLLVLVLVVLVLVLLQPTPVPTSQTSPISVVDHAALDAHVGQVITVRGYVWNSKIPTIMGVDIDFFSPREVFAQATGKLERRVVTQEQIKAANYAHRGAGVFYLLRTPDGVSLAMGEPYQPAPVTIKVGMNFAEVKKALQTEGYEPFDTKGRFATMMKKDAMPAPPSEEICIALPDGQVLMFCHRRVVSEIEGISLMLNANNPNSEISFQEITGMIAGTWKILEE